MINEIQAAVQFLLTLIGKNKNYSADQMECFQRNLIEMLTERFENHWFPDQPFKGQGYRCIRVNAHNRRDATIANAAKAAGVRYEDLAFPQELTIWVDPKEVCCRFGENKGSYCTLASFDDDKENYVRVLDNNESIHLIEDQSEKSTTKSTSSPAKPLSTLNQNQALSSSMGTNSNTNNGNSTANNSNSTSNNNSSNSNNKRRNQNSPRTYLSRRLMNHSSYMNYGGPMNFSPWFNNVLPPPFMGTASPPPFINGGHRVNKWMYSSNSNGPSRFQHWSAKTTLKV
ncbi:protein BTG3-like [Trichogramma pretiosum]|uniref:protein BTG3-like n=1 Tax=Trichogramma pretiosum TaxID=7493 RepID=UPI0006C9A666|nr:protein BTG3-like [Trichogramma pretiosum]XP_014223827.1 protein BTG3-like [Trichogramma pretiosum]XP_014223828.1 protein BTG3-like [Trichogramma pretiosum]XP_023318188.1 protein BTG3-like [Trichogramma pretiosum]